MANIGFFCFTQPTPPVELTLKQKIALLSSQQKTDLLNAFINKVSPAHMYKTLIPIDVIEGVFELIDNMQILAKQYMRGEVIITPAVTHIDSITRLVVIDTPAVMNTPPTTQAALAAILEPIFDDFTAGQVTAIVSAMMKWTKYDGTGTFAFYQSQIIL